MRKGLALIALLVAVAIAVRWYNETKVAQPPAVGSTSGPPLADAGEYFPHASGAEWTYQISTGPAEPLEYRELAFPPIWMIYGTRVRFPGLISNPSARSFLLRMKVEGPAAQQGKLRFPDGVEVVIEADDLGVFENADHVFWAIRRADGFTVFQVATYPPNSPEAREIADGGTSAQQDGYYQRPFFFYGNPGSALGALTDAGKPTDETLTFKGEESYQGTQFLHFQWAVRSSRPAPGVPAGLDADYLNSAFTEDMWFGRGEGLARLEQKVGGATSMVWSLSQFSPGQ